MKLLASCIFVSALLMGPRMAHAGDDARRLIASAEGVTRGSKTSASVMTMKVKKKTYERSYKIVIWDDSRKSEERALVKILGPALWRGFGTLKNGNQLKIFNPKSNHITVVGHSMMGDDWMGSHFTNDDLVNATSLADDFKIEPEKKWTADNELGESATFYRMRLTPTPSAPVAWGKIVYTLWERGGVVMPVSAKYYRKPNQSKPTRTLAFDGVKKMGGRLIPTRTTATVTSKPGEYTSITYSELRFDVSIPDTKFTEQALRK